ncbi:MAG: cytidine deaminase [Planctomycetota bacterium]
MVLFAHRFEKALSGFPPQIQAELHELVYRKKVVPSNRAAAWLDMMGVEIASLLVQLLPVAAEFARTSSQQSAHGAVALGNPPSSDQGPGNIYLGADLEISGQATPVNVHSEQAAILHAWMHGESSIRTLAVQDSPCGVCRQFLHESSTRSQPMRILVQSTQEEKRGAHTSHSLDDFLPAAAPKKGAPAAGWMEASSTRIDLGDVAGDSLVQHALTAASASSAPQSGGYGGLALLRSDGKVFSGRRIEHVNLPNGLSPLASALASLNMQLPPMESFDIRRAAMVECPSSSSQRELVRFGLAVVAPGVSLEYHPTESSVEPGL